MSMRDTLSSLFGRYSFAQHADQALALTQPSATAAPDLPPAGCAADTSPLRLVPPVVGDRPAAPTSRDAAGHPIDWDIVREGLAHLRAVMTDAIAWIDEIDPTPDGLAQVAADTRT